MERQRLLPHKAIDDTPEDRLTQLLKENRAHKLPSVEDMLAEATATVVTIEAAPHEVQETSTADTEEADLYGPPYIQGTFGLTIRTPFGQPDIHFDSKFSKEDGMSMRWTTNRQALDFVLLIGISPAVTNSNSSNQPATALTSRGYGANSDQIPSNIPGKEIYMDFGPYTVSYQASDDGTAEMQIHGDFNTEVASWWMEHTIQREHVSETELNNAIYMTFARDED